MKPKKILMILLAVFLLQADIALASGDLIYESFADCPVNQKPINASVKENGGTALIKSLKAGDNEANALVLTDTVSDGDNGVTVMFNFDHISSSYSAEFKFKMEGTLGGAEFILGNGSSKVADIKVGTNGEVMCSNGASYYKFSTKTAIRNWNTVRISVNPITCSLDARFNSETVYGLNAGNAADGLDSFVIKTTSGKTIMSVDYYKIEKNNLDPGIQPIKAPTVPDPVPHAIKDEINVMLNGEYHYFDYKPVMINDRVLLPVRRVYEMFDMEVNWEEETRTAICEKGSNKVEITADSYKAYVNGEERLLDVAATISESAMYVPIRFIAESLGAEVSWEDSTQTVIINKGAE